MPDLPIKLRKPSAATLMVGLILALHLFLVLKSLLPTFREINQWDEAVYINTGRMLAQGELPIFARNPLIAILYALTFLPFTESPYWLIESAAMGRVVLFSLMWLAAFLIGRELKPFAPSWIMIGILLVIPALTSILGNPSDALFAAMAGFAFWQFLAFRRTSQPKNLALASLFIGLASLARNDGLVLFPIFLLLAIALTLKRRLRWRSMLYAVAPFAAIVGGYIGLYGLTTGYYGLGSTERLYTAFQQGYSFDFQGDEACRQTELKCAVQTAEELYGTAEENNHSVLVAISRNPTAFLSHTVGMVRELPQLAIQAFGSKTAVVFFLFALRGLIEIVQRREYALLTAFLVWPAYLFVYFLTFFRVGYLQTSFFVLYSAAAIGVHALLTSKNLGREFAAWSVVWMTLGVLGFSQDNISLYFAAILMLVGFGLLWLLRILLPRSSSWVLTASLLLFSIAIILRGSLYNPPNLRQLRNQPEEQASLALQTALPRGALIASGAPGAAWAAHMKHFPTTGENLVVESAENLFMVFLENDVQAIYVDHHLSGGNPQLWELVKAGIGTYYDQIFTGREGSIRVLLVKSE